MPDFARFLPLSQRPRGDESEVGSDRREAIGAVVKQAAALVRDGGDADAFAHAAGFGDEYEGAAGTASDRLTTVAVAVRTGRRRDIRALATAACALLTLARESGRAVELDPLTAGAVALYAAGTAPFDRRAVIRGHTVRASDADWAFGSGPALTAPATAIAAFLLGVSDEAPRPVIPRR